MNENKTLTDVKNKLQVKANGGNGNGNTALAKADPLTMAWSKIKASASFFGKMLPSHLPQDEFMNTLYTELKKNPKLIECMGTLLPAIGQAASLGLKPGPLGECYFLPFKNKERLECQFVIGYQGMLSLINRSKEIASVRVRCVYENDKFVLKYGIEDVMEHTPYHQRGFDEPGAFIGVYLIANFKTGGYFFEYYPKYVIDQHKEKSKSRDRETKQVIGPWIDSYEEMAKKTAIRIAYKQLPKSTYIVNAVQFDETVKRDLAEDMTEVPDVINGEFRVIENDTEQTPHDPTTGEVIEAATTAV